MAGLFRSDTRTKEFLKEAGIFSVLANSALNEVNPSRANRQTVGQGADHSVPSTPRTL